MYYIYELVSKKYIRLSVSDRCLKNEGVTSVPVPDYRDYEDVIFDENSNNWIVTEKTGENIENILNKAKAEKLLLLDKLYSNSQFTHLINGICFSAVLKGEWYNSILEKRKSAARSRKDKLCYIRIPAYYSDDPNKTIKYFEGVLPLSFIEIIDIIWDELSLTNFRKKEYYLELINKAQTLEELPNISFQEIQTIDLNAIADQYILNPVYSEEDRQFVASKKRDFQYHFFSEFDINKTILQLYEGTNIIP